MLSLFLFFSPPLYIFLWLTSHFLIFPVFFSYLWNVNVSLNKTTSPHVFFINFPPSFMPGLDLSLTFISRIFTTNLVMTSSSSSSYLLLASASNLSSPLIKKQLNTHLFYLLPSSTLNTTTQTIPASRNVRIAVHCGGISSAECYGLLSFISAVK